jgi:hypothetical protein
MARNRLRELTLHELLERLQACPEAIKWSEAYQTFEQMWQDCPHPEWMLWSLQQIDYQEDSKLRLFAVACVRHHWDLLDDRRSRRAVEVAERFATHQASREDLRAARQESLAAAEQGAQSVGWTAAHAASRSAASHTVRVVALAAARLASNDAIRAAAWDIGSGVTPEAEEKWQASQLRRILERDTPEILDRANRKRLVEESC